MSLRKRFPPETLLARIYNQEFSSADIERIIFARHTAESIGMFEFLKRLFPDKANVIYATVLSLVADPYVKSDNVRHMSKFYLDEVLETVRSLVIEHFGHAASHCRIRKDLVAPKGADW